jgi:hypothetical protein
MSLHFMPRERSAIDLASGVSIPRPRVLPSTEVHGAGSIEFQYAFLRDGERIGGMGVFGYEAVVDRAGGQEWTCTLDLTPDWVLEDVFRFKKALGNTDDDLTFVEGLAQGLVNAFAGQANNTDAMRYTAISSVDALARVGVEISAAYQRQTDGKVVLADAYVPAHAS